MILDVVANNAHRFYDGNLGLNMVQHSEPHLPFYHLFVHLFSSRLLTCMRFKNSFPEDLNNNRIQDPVSPSYSVLHLLQIFVVRLDMNYLYIYLFN
jgi:hypothetical protein